MRPDSGRTASKKISNSPVAGENRLALVDLQYLAAQEDVVVSFKYRDDLYHVDAAQLTLSYFANDTTPVDPLLAFPSERGFPFLRKEYLRELPGAVAGQEAPLFRLERRQGKTGRIALYSWRQLITHGAKLLGRDLELDPPDSSLRALLTFRGMIAPEYLELAMSSLHADETFGQALIRLHHVSPRDLLFAALGGACVFHPTCHMANAIGRVLLEEGVITAQQWQAALADQLNSGKSLARLLQQAGACSRQQIRLAEQKLLDWPLLSPPIDKFGEILIMKGNLSRTQLVSALFRIQETGQTLETYLIERKICSTSELAAAKAWHDLKLRLRSAGKIRLGQILLENNALSELELQNALFLQVAREDPLGELLITEGFSSPEDVIYALLEQDRRMNELVGTILESSADKLDKKLRLFDLPGGSKERSRSNAAGKRKNNKKPASRRRNNAAQKPPRFGWPSKLLLGAMLVSCLIGGGVLISSKLWPKIDRAKLPGLLGSKQPHLELPGLNWNSKTPGTLNKKDAAPSSDRTALSHLSDAELQKIVSKGPIPFLMPEDIEQKGEQIEAALRKAEKLDPNFAKAMVAARKISGADLLGSELDNLEKAAPVFQAPAVAKPQQQVVATAPQQALLTHKLRTLEAIRTNTLLADTLQRQGSLKQRQGKLQEAKIRFRQATEVNVVNSRWHVTLGEIQAKQGNHKLALREFRIAAKLHPRSGAPWYFMAREALDQQKIALAYRYFKLSLKKEPKGPHAPEIRRLLANQ
ncbi:MAG: hypothetical protein HY692_07865 [Cyanobacteria bacterium NC_groundwater_1444_Ag_S-0.65um_54_12]|nr:hypothetical protein [Cyanobacteria bacterium NC_groundwater_1444_Ag_S-0.65um_54_12]